MPVDVAGADREDDQGLEQKPHGASSDRLIPLILALQRRPVPSYHLLLQAEFTRSFMTVG